MIPPAKFSVLPENEVQAVAHFEVHGFSPTRIERDAQGLSVLVFSPMTEEQALRFVEVFPVHLSAKIGIVVGNRPPTLQ
jgi:hypothetical protein